LHLSYHGVALGDFSRHSVGLSSLLSAQGCLGAMGPNLVRIGSHPRKTHSNGYSRTSTKLISEPVLARSHLIMNRRGKLPDPAGAKARVFIGSERHS